MPNRPTLYVLAGPNGAGKSTLFEHVLRHDPISRSAAFINADLIQRNTLRTTDMEAAYEAARLAETRRRECMARHESFITESTFSHPSKLDLIRDAVDAGYRVIVFHINVNNADISVSRVAQRVKNGGHPVPEQKVRERYQRNQALIREAVLLAGAGLVFDNSERFAGPTRVLEFRRGFVVDLASPVPEWVRRLYRKELTQYLRVFKGR